jgi:S-adenosylhomocysteine hydrolase
VHPLPADIDDAIARRRLELLGMQLEKPTTDQLEYARSWR